MAVWSRGVPAALAWWLLTGPAQAGEHDVLALARLWSEVRVIHPALADGAVDWDRALVTALPHLKGEDSEASLRAAAATLMEPLHDTALRIGMPAPSFVSWPADGEVLEWLPGDTALLHLHPGMRERPMPLVLPTRARRVILDLRPIAGVPYLSSSAMLHAVLAQLIVQPLMLPAPRYRFSTGPRPQDAGQWEGILPGFMQMETQPVLPALGARLLPLAVIVNDTQVVPAAVLALQRTGRAGIVAEEERGRSRIGPWQTLWLDEDLPVEFASGQLVWADGSAVRWQADRSLPQDRATGPASAPVMAAPALLAHKQRPQKAAPTPAMYPVRQDDAAYRDMRGYPHRTGRAIARRLNIKHATSFATSYQQLAMPQEAGVGVQLAYGDLLFPVPGPLYRGKVVMLINEFTQSQAEHLALAVEAATPVTFIGTPSAGANGDVREVVLPGNVRVSYSGLEVRHADGRQLQRLGVQPHIVAAPTVAGLRAARDEVLERAHQFLREDQH